MRRPGLVSVLVLAVVLAALGATSVQARHPLPTKTVTVDKLEVITATEMPRVASGEIVLNLPAWDTIADLSKPEFEKLAAFLEEHCSQTPGCQLTYETITGAVVAVKTPSGVQYAAPYKVKTKKPYPGPPRVVRTTLITWELDTYSLTVTTTAGKFCIGHDYEWSGYMDSVLASLRKLGPLSSTIEKPVVLIVHKPQEKDSDCTDGLASVRPAR